MLPTVLRYSGLRPVVFASILLTSLAASAQTHQHPWLLPARPTVLEWAILELQAIEGDSEFGENELTIAFHGGPRSASEGVIYCRISYLPSASAEFVQMVERGIRDRFAIFKKSYPWAKLEVVTEVARLKR